MKILIASVTRQDPAYIVAYPNKTYSKIEEVTIQYTTAPYWSTPIPFSEYCFYKLRGVEDIHRTAIICES